MSYFNGPNRWIILTLNKAWCLARDLSRQIQQINVIQLAGQRKMQSCLLAENSINKLVLPPTCIPLKSTDKIILLFYSPLACIARDKIY